MGSVVRGRRTITLKQKLKAVRIIATGTQFQGDTPPAITLKAMPQQFEAVSYSWTRLRDNKVLSTAQQITVKNGEVDVVETYRVEVKDRLDDVYIDTLSITKVTDGKPGDVGKRGQVIVQREWKEGDIYRNNDNVIDYVYHRATDSWWRLRDGYDNIKAGLNPSNQFVQLTSLEHLAVNNFVAENANIAGFIFKDKVLKSQLPNLTNPNLILDGVNGKIIANDAKIKGHIEATSGKFTGEINATSGNIKDVTATNLTVTNLNATNGSIKNITGDNITINSGTFKGKVIFEDGTSAQDAIDQKIKEGVDSIEVGGRNLVYGGFVNGFYNQSTSGTSESGRYGRTINKFKLVKGANYVLNFNINDGIGPSVAVWLSFYNNDGSFVSSIITTKGQLPLKFKAIGDMCGLSYDAGWYTNVYGGVSLKDQQPKLENGIFATPWTPAPEDIESKIDNIQVGGTNLLIKSKFIPLEGTDFPGNSTFDGLQSNGSYKITSTGKGQINRYITWLNSWITEAYICKGNTDMVLSADVRSNVEGKFFMSLDVRNPLKESELVSIKKTDTFYRIYIKYKGDNVLGRTLVLMALSTKQGLDTSNGDWVEYKNVKLELGNVGSDWSPSSQDLESQIKDQELHTEYSVNGTSAWHTPATSADRFMRQKKGDGAWGVALPFGKDGAKGDKGNTGDRGPEGIQGPVGEPLGDGVMLFTDPDFSQGNNSVYLYNNASNGVTTVERITRPLDAPSKSSHIIRVTNKGPADPGLGGYYQPVFARANAVFIHKIIAKIPVGYKIHHFNNPIGNGGSFKWLTSQEGTGRYETYIYKIICGTSGTFSEFGYVALLGTVGTTASPIIWDVCYSTIFDMSIPDRSLDFLKTTVVGNSIATGTLLVGQNGNATAGITGFRASGETSNVAFWAGLSYDNRNTAPFRVYTDGRLFATQATISGTINATAGTFNNVTANNLTVNSGKFTGTVNANAGTFNNVTANNLTVNSGTFKGRIEAESGYFGGFLVNNQGMINDITKNDHKLEFGYQVAWTGIKSALGMNYKFMYSEGTNALVHNCNSQIVNTATTGTDHNVALLLTAARSAGGRNHALVIEKGDIAGMALYTKHFGVTDNIQIYRESVVIYTPINGSWICHVSLPTGEYRYDGRTVTIMCAGNGKTKIIGRDAVIYSHEGHHSVGKVDNYIDFFNNSSKVTMTYSAEKNWWFVTHINIH
ncbi:hypothetical protein AS361_03660 [Myroides marinus]|uniref:hypothetical protein n=1 Tax=Myroides marinus TaxID=703342 RepID=UPI000741FB4F|nr:hypothetical protein [Myroides marinus]KUF38953.1 hypothetical protein AS361_03660 [Myroides marinus]